MGDQDYALERSWYIGNACFAILYGFQLSLYFLTLWFLISTTKKGDSSRLFYVVFSTVLTLLITVALAANLFYGQKMWMEGRSTVGGPVVYFEENIAIWYNSLGTAADVTANVLGDALMLYRVWVFWSPISRWVPVFPALLWLASTALSITATVQSALPQHDFFHGDNFTTPWLVLTISFNVIATALIAGRLLSVRRSLSILPKNDIYSTVSAILIESAAPFTLLGVGYIVTYVRGAPEALFFADVWGAFVGLSPQMILLRVAMGAAWTKQTATQFGANTAVVFTEHTRTDPGTGTVLRTFRSRDEGTSSPSGAYVSKRSDLVFEDV